MANITNVVIACFDEEIRKIITSLKEKISGKTTKIFNKEKETRGHFIKNPL